MCPEAIDLLGQPCRGWTVRKAVGKFWGNWSGQGLNLLPLHDQTFKKYMQLLCNFYMSNLFHSAFRPRLDVILTLHALRSDLEIWSGRIVKQAGGFSPLLLSVLRPGSCQ